MAFINIILMNIYEDLIFYKINNMKLESKKIIKIIIPILLIILFGYLLNTNIKNNIINNQTQNQSSLDDTLQINGIVGVFLGPNETEVNKMNKENGKGLEEYVADSQYYQKLAWNFLNKQNIKTIFTIKRYIEFTKDSGEKIIIDREKINLNDWGVILFDGKKDPLKVDMTVIESEYEKYFK